MKAYLFNYFKTFYSFLLKQSFIKTIYPIFVSTTNEQITTKTATQ